MADSIQSPQQRVRFGVYEVDLRAGELWKAGRRRKLTGQPFSVLAILLERPGEVVTRDELQKRLWPDTFVDVDHNLNTAINKIREALGDSSERPRFIETLSRRGYRFIASVESIQPDARSLPNAVASPASGPLQYAANMVAPTVDPPPATPTIAPEAARARTPRSKFSPKKRVAVWSAVLAAALGITYLMRPTMPPPQVTGVVQLTRDGAVKLYSVGSPPPAMLTDGSRIYFSEIGAQDTLMQVSTDGGDTLPVHLPFQFDYAESPSPGRQELLVGGGPSVDLGDAIWKIPLPAGQPRRIGNLFAHDATLSPDGEALYYTFGHDIFRANPDGSGSRKIITTTGIPFWIRLSPHGHLLRFSVYHADYATSSLWEARPDGSHARQLLPGWNSPSNECCGNWTGDGRYFVFQSTREGIANLWAMRDQGGAFWRKTSRMPEQLTVGEMSSQAPLPNKDGTKIFFVGATLHSEVVRYDEKTHEFTPYLPGLSAEGVAFAPDGKRVAYVTYPEGVLWESRADGTERRQLSFPPMQAALPRWSPDGTRIVFTSRAPGKMWHIYLVQAEGGDPEQLTTNNSDSVDAVWSPDGNSLAFSGEPYPLQLSKKPGIHILDLKTRRVTDMPGSEELFSPRWSPDGRYLLAMSVDFQKLVLYNFAERKWKDLLKMPTSYPAWSRDGKYIYFANPFDPKLPVYRLFLNNRKLEHIVDLSLAGTLADGPFGTWTGLAPDDSILATRDIGVQEIYALHAKFPP